MEKHYLSMTAVNKLYEGIIGSYRNVSFQMEILNFPIETSRLAEKK